MQSISILACEIPDRRLKPSERVQVAIFTGENGRHLKADLTRASLGRDGLG